MSGDDIDGHPTFQERDGTSMAEGVPAKHGLASGVYKPRFLYRFGKLPLERPGRGGEQGDPPLPLQLPHVSLEGSNGLGIEEAHGRPFVALAPYRDLDEPLLGIDIRERDRENLGQAEATMPGEDCRQPGLLSKVPQDNFELIAGQVLGPGSFVFRERGTLQLVHRIASQELTAGAVGEQGGDSTPDPLLACRGHGVKTSEELLQALRGQAIDWPAIE